MAEGEATFYVAGPFRLRGKWVLLCPECDEDRLDDFDRSVAQCTVEWLAGRPLEWDGRHCLCFETDPFEGEDVQSKSKRFFHYSAIARLLGGAGRRVNLPICVKDKIEDLYGKSEVGFKDNCTCTE